MIQTLCLYATQATQQSWVLMPMLLLAILRVVPSSRVRPGICQSNDTTTHAPTLVYTTAWTARLASLLPPRERQQVGRPCWPTSALPKHPVVAANAPNHATVRAEPAATWAAISPPTASLRDATLSSMPFLNSLRRQLPAITMRPLRVLTLGGNLRGRVLGLWCTKGCKRRNRTRTKSTNSA